MNSLSSIWIVYKALNLCTRYSDKTFIISLFMYIRIVHAWKIRVRNSNSWRRKSRFLFVFIRPPSLQPRFQYSQAGRLSVRRFSTPITSCSECSYLFRRECSRIPSRRYIDTFVRRQLSSCIGWLIGLRKRHRKVHDTKSRYENGAARLDGAARARGNVSVNVNANSNMPVIIISASMVAQRPFPSSSWHPFSFASVARRWPRGSLISRNCDDPRPTADS